MIIIITIIILIIILIVIIKMNKCNDIQVTQTKYVNTSQLDDEVLWYF